MMFALHSRDRQDKADRRWREALRCSTSAPGAAAVRQSPSEAGLSHMADFEESNGEQNGIASRTNPSMFHACSAYAIPLPSEG